MLLWVTNWSDEKCQDESYMVQEGNKYRLEFYEDTNVLDVWRHYEGFPWRAYSKYRDGCDVFGSRYADILGSTVKLPVVVTEDQFDMMLYPKPKMRNRKRVSLVRCEHERRQLEVFLMFHQQVPVDRAIGIVDNVTKQFTSPFALRMNFGAQRLTGGVIIGDYCSYTSSTVIGFFAQSTVASMLAIVKDTDYYTVSKLKQDYPDISVWWEAKDVDKTSRKVVMNYNLWQTCGHEVVQRRWHNVIIDECPITDRFLTSSLWVIDIGFDRQDVCRWFELFQWHELFGMEQVNSDVEDMFLFYNVVHNKPVDVTLPKIQVSHKFMKFTEDYPFKWMYRALQNGHSRPVELCKRLLHMEIYDQFDVLFFTMILSDGEVSSMLPFEELPPMEREGDYSCVVCQDEEAKGFVRNQVCEHVLCYSCMYQVNVLHQKCPLCRRDYGGEFYRSMVNFGWEQVKIPELWKRPTSGRMQELVHLVEEFMNEGKIVITSGIGIRYLRMIVQALQKMFEDKYVVICHEFKLMDVNMADIVLLTHDDLWYVRHHPGINTLITLDIDFNRIVNKCIYYYFRECKNKFVVAPAQGMTEVLANDVQWSNERKLLQHMLDKF
jgi:hypothetical protein